MHIYTKLDNVHQYKCAVKHSTSAGNPVHVNTVGVHMHLIVNDQ